MASAFRARPVLLGLALAGAVASHGTLASQAPHYLAPHATGMVMVRFHDSATPLRQASGTHVLGLIPSLGIAMIRTPPGTEHAALEALARDPHVDFAELDYPAHAAELEFPNDPGWRQQWGTARIEAIQAWSMIEATPDIVVAIVDSGIQLDHEDLDSVLWTNPLEIPGNGMDDDDNGKADDCCGWHFYHAWTWDGDDYAYLPMEDAQVADDYGHGTHVAGITGAKTNNRRGIAGMASGSRLMPVKVLDQYGRGWYSDIAQGIVYAVENGARVINISAGGPYSSQTLQAAVDYARAHDVLVIAAAGNDGGTVSYPAACQDALAVAATDPNDAPASFSSIGKQIDAAAPGVDIYSTWPWREGYLSRSGTSMASPHVAGLAALLYSAHPQATVAEAARLITSTAADVNESSLPGWDEYLGWGRVRGSHSLSATIHSGTLELAASSYQVPAGGTSVLTATLPLTVSAPITLAASEGVHLAPASTSHHSVLTVTATAGPLPGDAIVTATAGALTGTVRLRIVPGPVTTATVVASSQFAEVGSPLTITLLASDDLGNPPLDGIPIRWAAWGGTVNPERSAFYHGEGRTILLADRLQPSVVVTATLEEGPTATAFITVASSHRATYVPLALKSTAFAPRTN